MSVKAKKSDIDKIFALGNNATFWQNNVVVISLTDVSLGDEEDFVGGQS